MKLSNIKGGGVVPVMNKHGGNMHIRSIYLLYVYIYIHLYVCRLGHASKHVFRIKCQACLTWLPR